MCLVLVPMIYGVLFITMLRLIYDWLTYEVDGLKMANNCLGIPSKYLNRDPITFSISFLLQLVFQHLSQLLSMVYFRASEQVR